MKMVLMSTGCILTIRLLYRLIDFVINISFGVQGFHLQYNAANLASLINYKKTSKVYICGPTGFIADSIKYLDEINIPVENVFYEHFGPME